MKKSVIGILAHVDAGKTTLSEAFFYKAGCIRQVGRVDNKDAFLDHNPMERQRGITIFSKQASFSWKETEFTLLDTPGHVDFSAETERCLQVLDYAILVINASNGVQGHTGTLWRLLKQLKIPTFIFVNKMDLSVQSEGEILEHLKAELDFGCVNFAEGVAEGKFSPETYEEMALLTDSVEEVLETGLLSAETIREGIVRRQIFPCFFGAALKPEGVETLLDGMDAYMRGFRGGEAFAARVYKITRDEQGKRLTHLKVLGGSIKVREILKNDEKISQIRRYNGEKYETVNEATAGGIYAVTGIETSYAGEGIGEGMWDDVPTLVPVLSYRLLFPDETNPLSAIRDLRLLEDEMPELCVVWDEEHKEIHVKVMGQIQIEILKELVKERFGYRVVFDVGSIAYKETIANKVIGVGHFEPLRHYAEAHIRMEPGERGSGVTVLLDCSEDVLDLNWQRLIATHLTERVFAGVLTGSPLTDVRFSVINGRAHNKHTEGGDFRQATYRGVRQGLMQAESVLLEPFYRFTLDIPADFVGRAMTDLDSLHATVMPPEMKGERATLQGRGPVATLRDYQIHLNAYTHGTGHIFVSFDGYDVCHNPEEVIEQQGYDPESDVRNPSSSVFCAHGSGFIVPWNEVPEYMHVFDKENFPENEEKMARASVRENFDYHIGTEEVDAILNRTFHSNKNPGKSPYKKTHAEKPAARVYGPGEYVYKPAARAERILLVDGYNVIFAWDELKGLAAVGIDTAKDRLVSLLSAYQSITDYRVVLVFDGYRVKGGSGSNTRFEGIEVVHTKEGLTADQYIERYTKENSRKKEITVASSDGLIQQITRGHDCRVISSKELELRIQNDSKKFREENGLE